VASKKIDISPSISPDILKTISSTTVIKTFGDQLINQAKEKIISVATGKIEELKKLIEEKIIEKIKVGVDHNIELKRLETIYKSKQITEEQYKVAVNAENISYENKIKDLEAQQIKLKQDLNNILSDPYKKIKAEFQTRKNKLKKQKVKNKKERAKAKRNLIKKVIINTAKNLAPVIALQLVKQLFTIINQRKRLEVLVDQVNNYIDTQVKDENTVIIATNLRNNAITLIDNSIKKLEKLKKSLDRLVKTLAIISAIVASILIILNLPIPFLIPIQIKLQPILQKLLILISALTTILAIVSTVLDNEITKIKELKDRLKEISLNLDGKTLDFGDLNNLTNNFLPIGDYGSYKGFKFQIKEEQNPQFVVRGNKRRYAVAINRSGIEQLKSEFSFTLDPNDLIEQLKLVIDQQNLQG